jgi:mono/diheme cytochrome c family protein
MNTRHLVLVLGLSAFVAAACSKTDDPKRTNPTQSSAVSASVDVEQAKTIYQERCSACHGPNGQGDGPGSAALNPKPRNYHDRAWQATVTDEQIKRTITYGGAAVGKSPIMPASPDLEQKPEVVDGLVKIVRGFGG